MTKLEDLEKRINWGYIFTLIVLFLLAMVATDVAIYKIQQPQFDYLNPCELGLMEWEDEIKIQSNDFYEWIEYNGSTECLNIMVQLNA